MNTYKIWGVTQRAAQTLQNLKSFRNWGWDHTSSSPEKWQFKGTPTATLNKLLRAGLIEKYEEA